MGFGTHLAGHTAQPPTLTFFEGFQLVAKVRYLVRVESVKGPCETPFRIRSNLFRVQSLGVLYSQPSGQSRFCHGHDVRVVKSNLSAVLGPATTARTKATITYIPHCSLYLT